MDETVLSIADFKLLEKPEQAKLLKNYLSKMTKRELAKSWGCSNGNVDNWRKRLGMTEARGPISKPNKVKSDINKVTPELNPNLPRMKNIQAIVDSTYVDSKPMAPTEVISESQAFVVVQVQRSERAFSLRLEKEMLGSEVKEALLSYASILDDAKVYALLLDIGGD